MKHLFKHNGSQYASTCEVTKAYFDHPRTGQYNKVITISINQVIYMTSADNILLYI